MLILPNYIRSFLAAINVKTLWSGIATIKHNSGFLMFKTSRIVLSGPGIARIYIERIGGFDGAISCAISTYSTTGDCAMTAGTHFAATTETINYADGEAGVKYVDIIVSALPSSGLHFFGVEMTNATGGAEIRAPLMHVYCDDGGVNSAATTVTGSVAQDLQDVLDAVNAGDLIYLRDTGGAYTYNTRKSGEVNGGYTLKSVSGTKTAPIVIAGYPGDSPVIDNNYSDTHDSAGNRVCNGFYLTAGAVNYIHIKGLEIINTKHCPIYSYNSGTYTGIVVEDCHFHDIGKTTYVLDSQGDNIGGVRLDNSTFCIVRNNNIHDIYDGRSSYTSNNINAEPYGLHSGIHGFDVGGLWVHHNTINVVKYGVYSKRSAQDGTIGYTVNNNYSYDIEDSTFHLTNYGSAPGRDTAWFRNVSILTDGTAPEVSHVWIVYRDAPTSQPNGFFIFNNTCVGGKWAWNAETMEGIIVYNNVYDSTSYGIKMLADSAYPYNNQLDYMDYNCLYNLGTFIMYPSYPTSYSSLSNWQQCVSVSGETNVNQDPDNNSVTIQPIYTDSGAGDYTTSNLLTSGRFSQPMGIGTELVGQQ